MRVCVFRIGNVGDIACALPALRAVRLAYPNARLTLLSSPGLKGMPSAADVLAGATWVDEIRLYHAEDIDTLAKRMALLRELRARHFDVWIDLPNDLTPIARQLRDMAFARLAGAKWARGWRINTIRWAAQAQSEHLRFPNEVDRLLGIVRDAGFALQDVEFEFPRPHETTLRVDDLLRSAGLSSDRLVAIAPGAKRSTNRWLPERFAAVGRLLVARGYAVVLIGEKPEADLCRKLAADIGGRSHSFAGDLTIGESSEVLRRCELAVCLDSGAQHLACAVGTACLSLFSFWQMRGKWHPYGNGNVVLQKWVQCHTCMQEECPNGNRCMKAIETDDVVNCALDMLDARAQKTS